MEEVLRVNVVKMAIRWEQIYPTIVTSTTVQFWLHWFGFVQTRPVKPYPAWKFANLNRTGS